MSPAITKDASLIPVRMELLLLEPLRFSGMAQVAVMQILAFPADSGGSQPSRTACYLERIDITPLHHSTPWHDSAGKRERLMATLIAGVQSKKRAKSVL